MVWAAGLIIVVAVLFLIAPVRFSLVMQKPGRSIWMAQVAWAGDRLGLGWRRGGPYLFCGRLRLALPRRRQSAVRERPGRRNFSHWWQGMPPGRRQAAVRLGKEIIGATSFAISGDIRYGFDDPALTAWLHGLVCAGRSWPGLALAAEPDFGRAGWDGELAASAELRPVRLVVPLIRFGFAYMRTKQMIREAAGYGNF